MGRQETKLYDPESKSFGKKTTTVTKEQFETVIPHNLSLTFDFLLSWTRKN